MNNLYRRTQRTFQRHTASQLIGNAEISVMRAGTVEITINDLPGVIASQTEDGDLVLADMDGTLAVVSCTDEDEIALGNLEAECERRQLILNA